MKLFEVEISAVTYVVAEDKGEAESIANDYLSDMDWDYSLVELYGENIAFYADFTGGIPYGKDYISGKQLTIEQIIALIKADARTKRMEAKMAALQPDLI